jgi:hypothetical protein
MPRNQPKKKRKLFRFVLDVHDFEMGFHNLMALMKWELT